MLLKLHHLIGTQKASRGFMVEQITLFCPTGQTGTPPNCTDVIDPSPNPTCADSGQTGTYPDCTPTTTTTCEDSGQIGTFPNCSDPNTTPDMCASDENRYTSKLCKNTNNKWSSRKDRI